MTKKSILTVALLAISAAGLAMATSSFFTLATPATLGTHKLKPGDYEVSVKKDQAVITDPNGKTFSVPVTIGQSDKKFSDTSVGVSNKNGESVVTEIDLGGSTTKLTFGN